MNTLPKAALSAGETPGRALAKEGLAAPFPYVVLGGRSEISDTGVGRAEFSGAENERAWFAAHVELSAPRWGNAREALVRSLAIDSQAAASVPASLQDDAAWDGGAAAAPGTSSPVNQVPLAPVAPAAAADSSAPIKLRAKRRAPSLEAVATAAPFVPASAPVPQSVTIDPGDAVFPLLKEGAAPLVPLPVPGNALASAALPPAIKFTPVEAPAPVRQSDGRIKKAIGMVLLSGLLVAAGVMLILAFVSNEPDAPDAVAATATEPASPVPAPQANPAAAAQPAAVSGPAPAPASVVAEPARPAAGPVVASQAFADYVAGLRVSGVSLGASPRVLINGRMIHLGDVIDPALGVRLVAVDGSARQLLFEDRSTARIQVRY